MVPFALVLDLRFLGKVTPLASWLGPTDKLNKVKKVVIWKSLVAKGCRGMGLGETGLECLEKPGKPLLPEQTSQPGHRRQPPVGAKKVSLLLPPRDISKSFIFLASWLRSKKGTIDSS